MNIRVAELSSSLLAVLDAILAERTDARASRLRDDFAALRKDEISSLLLTKEGAAPSPASEVLHVRDLTIDPKRREVRRAEVSIELTAKEFDILYFLALNRGQVFTKEEIYNAVWEGKYYLDDSNIMSFIRKLRKKLEPNPDDPVYILTVWGVGYKLSEK